MNQVNEVNRKHIVVTEKLYKYIQSQGKFGESFDDVIQRLIAEGRTKEDILKLAEEEY